MARQPVARTAKAPAKKAPAKKTAKKTAARKLPAKRKPPALPQPRDGEVFDPAYLAHRLRLQGYPWEEIAQLTGYANSVTANMAVTAYLQRAAIRMSKERAEEALQVELEFLDALKTDWWDLGTRRHDKDAANILLKISAQRTKLLEHFAEGKQAATSRTVVISGDSAAYISGLQRMVEGDASEGGAGES